MTTNDLLRLTQRELMREQAFILFLIKTRDMAAERGLQMDVLKAITAAHRMVRRGGDWADDGRMVQGDMGRSSAVPVGMGTDICGDEE